MKIVVLDKPRENVGEIDWSEVEKLGEARIYDDTLQEDIAKTNDFREQYGYGSSKVTNKLLMFLEWFGHCKKQCGSKWT